MATLEIGAKVLLLFVVWTLLASPIFVAAFFVGRAIKRKRRNSGVVTISLAVVVAALAALVPTPIITLFIPNGFALLMGPYYKDVFGNDVFSQLLPGIATSPAVTLVAVCAIALRYVGVTTRRKDAPTASEL